MKWLTFSITVLVSAPVFANGGPYYSGNVQMEEQKLEQLGRKPSSIREKAAKNPRNRAFPKSFQKVDEPEAERMEKQGVEDLADDPFYHEEAREE